MIKIILSFLILNTAFAKTLITDPNGDYSLLNVEFSVAEIVRDYAKLKNINLIMTEAPKGKLLLLGPKKIKKEKIDLYISAVVSEVGYTFVLNKELNQIQVMPTRNVRYHGGKLYSEIENVPDSYNHAMFSMKLKHAKAGNLSRNMRPFMSRYGRVIDEKTANTLIISDTGKNIKRLYKLVKSFDTSEFEQNVKFLKKINKKGKEVVETEVSTLDFIKDQHILFIIIFSLIAGIMGFGLRGYLMKRVEGGW
jgi:type II secretory pathway component GspD/PulD (secretin)